MFLFALIVMGTMFASPLLDEPFLEQNGIEELEADIEQPPSQTVKNPEEPDTLKSGIEELEADIEHHVSRAVKNPEESDTLQEPITDNTCCFSPHSTLFAGASYSYVSLKQTDLPEYSGNLWSTLIGYQYRKQDGLYAALKGFWRQGNTTGSSGQNYLYECQAEERVGYDFSFGSSQRGSIALYMGLGYRFMEQELQQPGLPDVALAYNNFYVPIGTSIDFAIPLQNSCLSFGVGTTWMPQIYPTVNIIPLGGARWILEYELVNGVIELPIQFSHCNGFSLTVKPLFEYWKDGASIAVGSLCDALGLPASSYLFGSVDLEFGWRF